MFTGIIEETGSVKELIKRHDSMRITIHCMVILENIKPGDSISVNGICVTVVAWGGNAFSADISPETYERTSLQHITQGKIVNLERALSPTSRIGGHFVTGHIDGTGVIHSIKDESGFQRFVITPPSSLVPYIASKGSIAIDGISLTPYDCTKNSFSVMIIPHTFEATNMKSLHAGDIINIECDILSKYIEQLLSARNSGLAEESSSKKIDTDFLDRAGFL